MEEEIKSCPFYVRPGYPAVRASCDECQLGIANKEKFSCAFKVIALVLSGSK